eukprot:scaffold190908_cov67-Attheya_sp.AAC.4
MVSSSVMASAFLLIRLLVSMPKDRIAQLHMLVIVNGVFVHDDQCIPNSALNLAKESQHHSSGGSDTRSIEDEVFHHHGKHVPDIKK